jgi:hypothetical protein
MTNSIIGSLLNLFGYGRSEHKERILTRRKIENTSDNELLLMIFNKLSKEHSGIPEEIAIKSWNRSKQAIYIIWLLESEVNNGGFWQFFVNSSGKFYYLIPGSLELVGASRFAELTTNVNSIYDAHASNISKKFDTTFESHKSVLSKNLFDDFDSEFYSLYALEDLHQIQVKFIRENINDFLD